MKNMNNRKWKFKILTKNPRYITLCPPGACPPDNTTPIFKADPDSLDSPGTNIVDGCPNRDGKSFAISSESI